MQEVDCEWLWQLDVTKIEVDKEGKVGLLERDGWSIADVW